MSNSCYYLFIHSSIYTLIFLSYNLFTVRGGGGGGGGGGQGWDTVQILGAAALAALVIADTGGAAAPIAVVVLGLAAAVKIFQLFRH